MGSAEILFSGIASQKESLAIADEKAGRKRQSKSRVALYLLTLLIVSYSYFIHRGVQWNAESRLDLTFALVDQGTLVIDAYHQNTQDKSYYNGHYFTDKAIGVSLFAAPVYALLKSVTLLDLLSENYFLVRYLVTFFIISIPSAIFGVLFYKFLLRFSRKSAQDDAICLFVALGFSLGTIAFPFSTLLFGHQLAGVLLFASFLVLFDLKRGQEHTGWKRLAGFLAAGFLAGLAVLVEYPAFIGLGLLAVFAVSSKRVPERRVLGEMLRQGISFLIGATPPIIVILVYNYIAFGHPLSQGYANLGGAPEFAEGMSKGFMGITWPTLSALWGITFSPYRGLFLLSPFLLLALPGLWLSYKAGWRAETILFASVSAGYFLLNASYLFWDGGASLGPRHVIPSLPFLAAPVVFAAQRWRRVFLILVARSIVTVALATALGPIPYQWYQNPFFEQFVPMLLEGEVGTNNWGMAFGLQGISTLLPWTLLFAAVVALLVHVVRYAARGAEELC